MDEELFTKQLMVENKIFYVDLRTNHNGMYLKISEKSGGKKHNVLLPSSGIKEFKTVIDEISEYIDNR